MEVSHAGQPVSPAKSHFKDVVLKRVSGWRRELPATPIPPAMAISLHSNTSFDSLQLENPIYDSASCQSNHTFSSLTTGVFPTPSSASSSVTVPYPKSTFGEGLKASILSASVSSILKYWKWEIAACMLVVAVPIITFATIFPHNNQPIPQWPFKISINALLSVYSLVFKSAIAYVVTSCVGQLQWAWYSPNSQPRALSDVVLFDNAGRGPWGLLAILWAHRLQQPLIILAAVIMVSGIAIDPFTQQLIRPFDCNTPLNHEDATLPRTNKIDSYFIPGVEGQISARALRSALVAGLSSPGNEIPWNCSTGNCTFSDTYSTLGICSTCEDVSDEVVIKSNVSDLSGDCSTQEITTGLSSGDGGNYWGANHDQLNISFSDACNGDGPTDVARMDIHPYLPEVYSLRVDVLVGKTTYSDVRRLISTGQNITGCDIADAGKIWECRGYGAATCFFKPCVRTYSATVEAGHLTEHLVSRSSDIRWGTTREPSYYGILDTQCMSAQEVAFLTAVGYEMNATTRWIPFDGDLRQLGRAENYASRDWLSNLDSLLHHKCLHLIGAEFMRKIGYGTLTSPSIHNTAASQFVGTVQGTMWDEGESNERILSVFDGPEVLQNMYNYGRVDFERIQSVFENISDSLTTFIRTNGNASYSESVKGGVQHYATCLSVQWPWITLPAVLAILNVLLLVLVMESTRRHATPIWKASLLPWVLGSDLGKGNLLSSAQGLGEAKDGVTVARMEDESRQILVAVSEGTAPMIEMVHMRDHNLQTADG